LEKNSSSIKVKSYQVFRNFAANQQGQTLSSKEEDKKFQSSSSTQLKNLPVFGFTRKAYRRVLNFLQCLRNASNCRHLIFIVKNA
jgi:hypothetical protein